MTDRYQPKVSEHFAAIDLGSNALRALIVKEEDQKIFTVRNVRDPLRLGEDVFDKGIISPKKFEKTEEVFIELFHLFMSYNVTKIRAVATSAMRDAKNADALKKAIEKTTGIELEIITGEAEAQIIFEAVHFELNLKKKNCLLMDIGGGSTELTIVEDDKILASKSFNIGTVRLLHNNTFAELDKELEEQEEMMMDFIKKSPVKSFDHFIGTGGNLRRIGKIRKKVLGKDSSEKVSFKEIEELIDIVKSMTVKERVENLDLDPNHADVLLPALLLTQKLMKKNSLKEVLLPRVGLKEGLILSLLDFVPEKFVLKD